MGKLSKMHWVLFCILIFLVSRIIMLYQFSLISDLLLKAKHISFFSSMCKWDCQWYLTIIQHGYDLHPRTTPHLWKGLANWAFFPLYPYLVKFLSFVTSVSPIATGIILNQIFILIALHVFYLYLKLYFDEVNSRYGVILFAFSPFNIYFASLYTEALFLLLSLTAFYLMKTNRPILAAICGGFLSATRPLGCMFSIPFIYYTYFKGNKVKAIIGFFIALSGLVLYMIYLHHITGDYLAFEHIQRKWGREGIQWHHLSRQLDGMVTDKYNLIMFLFSVCLSIYLVANRFITEAMFNLLCILPGVLSGAVMSEGRFSGTLFTFCFAFTVLARNSKTLKILFAFLFVIFYLSYILYWLAHAKFLI